MHRAGLEVRALRRGTWFLGLPWHAYSPRNVSTTKSAASVSTEGEPPDKKPSADKIHRDAPEEDDAHHAACERERSEREDAIDDVI
jgi:hypothetical protein